MSISDSTRHSVGLLVCAALAGCSSQGGASPAIPKGAALKLAEQAPMVGPMARPLTTYSWHEISYNSGSYGKAWTKGKYFNGTVPVVVDPAPGNVDFTDVYLLLDKTDSNGDHGDYVCVSSPCTFWFAYMTGLASDTFNYANFFWGVTKKGAIWSTYPQPDYDVWIHYFNGYTSIAVHNPTAPNPKGFLFATSSTKFSYPSDGPSGPSIMLFKSTGKWPKGTWTSTGWGAYQVSADPMGEEIAALDENGVVWEIYPYYIRYGVWFYTTTELSTAECANKRYNLTFEAVAVKDATFLGLDAFEGHAVWDYDWKNKCWNEIGTKTGFVSIATEAAYAVYTLVWAVDNKANLWVAR